MRGPARRIGHLADLVALLGLIGLGALCWYLHIVTPAGADPWLFRGGLFLTGVVTLAVIAGVTHRRAFAGPLLGNPILLWIGLRSYGIYLYHWPIYQIMRRVAGKPLSVTQFVVAFALTMVIAEVSYRFVEMPIRRGHVGRWWRRLQRARDPAPRRIIAAAGAGFVALSLFAATNLATAELEQNEIAQSLDQGREAVTDVLGRPTASDPATTVAGAAPGPAGGSSPPASAAPGSSAPNGTPAAAAAPTIETPITVRPRRTTTTTTAAPKPIPILAIGDSVMLGAAEPLAAEGIVVDAEVSRQMNRTLPEVQALRDSGRLGDAVIVHLGTNGPIADDALDSFFDVLKDVPTVLVLTVRAPGIAWVDANNAKLYGLAQRYPNVQLVDWAGLSNTCPGNCFYDDGIHLRPDGQRYYTQIVKDFLEA